MKKLIHSAMRALSIRSDRYDYITSRWYYYHNL